MAMDPRKRQKKLERRKAKHKATKQIAAQRKPNDLITRIERSAAAPILHCCTSESLWDQGMASVLVSRQLNSGHIAFVAFLVDMYCLGVKDVALDVAPRARYEDQAYGKLFRGYRIVHLEPAAARKLVEGAVAYANEFGLPPHRDYRKAMSIFGDIDADSCTEEFVYGKDGNPLFIAGPNDNLSRCEQVMRIVSDRSGPDGLQHEMPLIGTETSPAGTRVLTVDDRGDINEQE